MGMEGMVFAPFWSENGYRLCLFWSEYSGMVFEGMHERICRFNSKWIRKKECKYANSRGILKKSFCWQGVLI